jgi:hypothetical protein
MSVVFNADEDSGAIKRLTWTEDIREVHPVMWIVFISTKFLSFTPTNTIRYRALDWVAVSVKRLQIPAGYSYSVLAYPQSVVQGLTRTCSSASDLASFLKLSLSSDSINYAFEYPMKAVMVGPALYKYRYQTFEQYKDDPGKALFLFVNQNGLTCKTYKAVSTQRSIDFVFRTAISESFEVSLIDDGLLSAYTLDSAPKYLTYKHWINYITNIKVDMESVAQGTLGYTYNLRTGESDIDSLTGLVLIRQEYDNMRSPRPYKITFGRIEI